MPVDDVQGGVDPRGNRGIVRGDHQRQPQFAPQLPEQIEHRFAGCAVEVAGRFVGDQIGGSLTSARAMATRCCCPPES